MRAKEIKGVERKENDFEQTQNDFEFRISPENRDCRPLCNQGKRCKNESKCYLPLYKHERLINEQNQGKRTGHFQQRSILGKMIALFANKYSECKKMNVYL